MQKSKGSLEMPEWMQLWASSKSVAHFKPLLRHPGANTSVGRAAHLLSGAIISKGTNEAELSESGNNRESNVPEHHQI